MRVALTDILEAATSCGFKLLGLDPLVTREPQEPLIPMDTGPGALESPEGDTEGKGRSNGVPRPFWVVSRAFCAQNPKKWLDFGQKAGTACDSDGARRCVRTASKGASRCCLQRLLALRIERVSTHAWWVRARSKTSDRMSEHSFRKTLTS